MRPACASAPRPATTADHTPAPAIVLDRVGKEYPGGVRALDEVSLTVERGMFLAVMGPSGSGKSTLMRCAAGFDSPTSGSIRIDGHEIAGLNETRRTELRRERIGFVFQTYNLIPSLTIEDNITLPLRLAGRTPDIERLPQRHGSHVRCPHHQHHPISGRTESAPSTGRVRSRFRVSRSARRAGRTPPPAPRRALDRPSRSAPSRPPRARPAPPGAVWPG
ncbi:ABC-type sugar transport system ATPase subunit [Streptomyces sp. LBL]|nr:ATP-binding cassette domain-containing protein [Streptomyces sp. LBL]MDH6628306.1 ABC-type sugar transport system ATPase subunit [Streptomyces sp. LBL]